MKLENTRLGHDLERHWKYDEIIKYFKNDNKVQIIQIKDTHSLINGWYSIKIKNRIVVSFFKTKQECINLCKEMEWKYETF